MELLNLSEAKAMLATANPTVTATDSNPLSPTEIAQLLRRIPEIAEAFTQAEIELAIDDRGWIGGTPTLSSDVTPQARQVVLGRARRYWRDDPLAKQAVRVWTNYCFGAEGISYDCGDDDATKEQLNKIFKHPINKRLLNAEGQHRSSKKLLVDGDVFFLIFDGDPKQIRYMDPVQVKKIITNPNDEEHIVGYKRETADGKTFYYKDWAGDIETEVSNSNFDPSTMSDPDTQKAIKWEEGVVCYHAAFDALQKWGNGLLNCVVDWSKEHRLFMYARVAIIQALMQFAFKTNVKGGQAAINALASSLKSSLVTTGLAGAPERNPSPAPGGNFLQNAGLDLTPMPRTTGATDAKGDSDTLKLMVCAGSGIMLHYYGDPSTGNLATATAMELPMLKQFQAYQSFWKDVYTDLICIFLDRNEADNEADDESEVTVSLPPILDEDLAKLAPFITALTTTFPETKVAQVLKQLLQYLDIDNVDEVMEEIKKKRDEIDKQQADAAKVAGQLPNPNAPQTPEQKQAQQSMDKMAEAVAQLYSLLK